MRYIATRNTLFRHVSFVDDMNSLFDRSIDHTSTHLLLYLHAMQSISML